MPDIHAHRPLKPYAGLWQLDSDGRKVLAAVIVAGEGATRRRIWCAWNFASRFDVIHHYTLDRCLAKFVRRGLLTVERHGRSNHYTVTPYAVDLMQEYLDVRENEGD